MLRACTKGGVIDLTATGPPLLSTTNASMPGCATARSTWLKGKTGHEIAGCCIQAATRDFARFGLRYQCRDAAPQQLYLPRDQIGNRRYYTLVRHVLQFNAGQQFELFGAQVRGAAGACRAEVVGVGAGCSFGLGEGDEVFEVFCRD